MARANTPNQKAWVGFYKKGFRQTQHDLARVCRWPVLRMESTASQALDEDSYVIRFTPRKTSSVWSSAIPQRRKTYQREPNAADGLQAFAGEKNTARYLFL